MNMTVGCPIPGASQPKESLRLIDIKEVLQYDGAHFTWSGGKNCLAEQKAAYARGYDDGMKFIVDEAKKAPTINPDSLRPAAKWIEAPDEGADGSWEACSRCAWESRWAASKYKYCPHCGARMVNADE